MPICSSFYGFRKEYFQGEFGDQLSSSGATNSDSPSLIFNGVPDQHVDTLRRYMVKPIPQRAACSKDIPMRKISMPFVSQLPRRRYCLALLLLSNRHISILNRLMNMYLLQPQLSPISYFVGDPPLT